MTNRKRASYREAVAWIALNDAPADLASVDEVAGYISTSLVAELWGKTADEVARDVVRYRERNGGDHGQR